MNLSSALMINLTTNINFRFECKSRYFSLVLGNSEDLFTLAVKDISTFDIELIKNISSTTYNAWILNIKFVSPSQGVTLTTVTVIKTIEQRTRLFTKERFNSSVFENATLGDVVLKLETFNRTANQFLHYKLLSNTTDLPYKVDELTGDVSVTQNLDFESTKLYSFYVHVIDITKKPLIGDTARCDIRIMDSNDHQPVFVLISHVVSVAENVAIGTMLVMVTATDKDSGPRGRVSYFIQPANDLFAIDPLGAVRVKRSLDFETQNRYFLNISARDNEGNVATNHATVQIDVANIDEFRPAFQAPNYYFPVLENQTVPYDIGQVLALDKDRNGTIITYTIPGSINYVSVNENGLLTLNSKLDYETLKAHVFTVQAFQEKTLQSETSVTLQVVPVNDNPPVIRPLTQSISVNENQRIGFVVAIFYVNDADGSQFSVKLTPADTFAFEMRNNNSVHVILKKSLDYESVKQYSLTLSAVDESGLASPNNAQLSVKVINVNDNPISFEKLTYTFNIAENTLVDTVIGQVKATDVDNVGGGSLKYSIIQSSVGDVFTLVTNDTAAYIKLKSEVDFEKKNSYQLTITATNRESQTNVVVYIVVFDINDTPPALPAPYTLSVYELTPLDIVVGSVRAQDPDSQRLSYSILNTTDESSAVVNPPLSINSTSGELKLVQILDYQQAKLYIMYVEVSDGIFSDVKAYTVNIIDQNSNPPVFTSTVVNVTIAENAAIGSSVISVSASDSDTGQFGVVNYKLLNFGGDADFPFMIAKDGGKIGGLVTVTRSLDYETRKSYDVAVEAYDNPADMTMSRSALMFFTILVSDINDVLPRFEQTSYSMSLIESAPRGFSVLSVSAVDPDGPDTFTFSSEGADSNAFNIGANNGTITLAKSLDYLQKSRYSFKVSVRQPKSEFTASADVIIDVIKPVPLSVSFLKSRYDVSIAENSPSRELLTLATNINSDVRRFSLFNNADSTKFEINSGTGVFSSKTTFDYEEARQYYVLVMADYGTKQAQTLVVVTITNVDDERPVFTSPLNEDVTLNEGMPVGNIVAVFVASDADMGSTVTFEASLAPLELVIGAPPGAPNGIAYDAPFGAVTNDKPFRVVSVGANTGKLILASALNSLNKSSYVLTISAKDSAGNFAPNTASINITVSDVNDNIPQFNQSNYVFRLSEDFFLDTVFGNVLATDVDRVHNKISYRLVEGEQYFTLEKDTGGLSLLRQLDYETKQVHHFAVVAEDDGPVKLRSVATVIVNVDNINDNAPEIQPPFSYDISETVPLNSVVFYLSATDVDLGADGTVSYSISDPSNTFTIDSKTGAVRLTKVLDSSTKNRYSVDVTASDSGTEPKSMIQKMDIKVIDENINAPSFIEKEYRTDIDENLELYSTVLTVSATDRDYDLNGKINYIILPTGTSLPFAIGSTNGSIFTTNTIDYEAKTSYSFIVEAFDFGDPSLKSVVLVVVNIFDKNDNKPVFSTLTYERRVTDQASIGQSLLKVEATDADSGNNGLLTYSFAEGTHEQFSINSTTGLVSLKTRFLQNNTQTFILRVEVSDGGGPPRKADTNAIVILTKLQTQTGYPKFILSHYAFSVREGTSGVIIGDLNATDSNTRPGNLRFSMMDGGSSRFTVLQNGGVRVNANLDYETKRSYTFNVRVTDDSFPPAMDESQVTINVVDVDDEKPVFIVPTDTHIKISEQTNVGQVITIAQARDSDVVSRNIVYSLKSLESIFEIRSVDNIGVVVLKKTLNCSDVDNLPLEISAVDEAGNAADTNLILNVSAIDENQHCPVFTEKTYFKTIRENELLPKGFLQVSAKDRDCTVANSKVYYQVVDSIWNDFFQIDSETGQLSMIKTLDFEKNATSLELYVSATNQNRDQCNSLAKISIQVIDQNDVRPSFQPPFQFTIKEDVDIGDVLFRVSATDKESGDNGKVTYTLAGDNLPFRIIESSGNVLLVKKLDYEVRNTYEFKVIATDQGNEPLTSTEAIRVTILNVNDNPPVFVDKLTTAVINEESPIGTFVGCVSATDTDIGEDGKVIYSILPYVDASFFSVNSSGCIVTASVIDIDGDNKFKHNDASVYNVIVKAEDNGTVPLSATKTIALNVKNINDNFPYFQSRSYEIGVAESTPIGTFIVKVNGFDEDKQGGLTYLIKSGNDAAVFSINATSGQINLAKTVDFETVIRKYVLAVSVSDGTRVSQSNGEVTVNVLNSDDNQPTFALNRYSIEISEQALTGPSVLIKLTANDNDRLGTMSYSISQSPDATFFKINLQTGDVTLRQQLNYEIQRVHVLTIIATSTERNALIGSTLLVVNVTDFNDNRPIIAPPLSRKISIKESMKVGSLVTNVVATDTDSGLNGQIEYRIATTTKYFDIDKDTGIIFLKGNLDSETVGEHTIEITVVDKGVPQQASSDDLVLKITVVDLNEHAPVFAKSFYSFNISELTNVGASITTFIATDNDSSAPNNKLSFSLQGTDRFTVNSETGLFTLAKIIDYEQKQTISFLATVKDGGDIPLESSVVVVINIINQNDNAPTLSGPFQYAMIENLPVNERIFTVKGFDLDGDKVTFKFAQAYPGFELDSETGVVIITSPFDYEQRKEYKINVTVTDGTLSGSALYTVTVLNANDNQPEFLKYYYSFSVDENAALDSRIGCVSATDQESAILNYNLKNINGNATTYFLIEKTTGCISLIKSLDRENIEMHQLKVAAYDTTRIQLRSVATVDIVVSDYNDNPPIFSPSSYNIILTEKTLVNTTVLALNVSDADAGVNSALKFSILSGNNLNKFTMTPNGGLVLRAPLDYESQARYVLLVVATDQGQPQLNSNAMVIVTVVNENENTPKFERNFYSVTLLESQALDVFLTVKATDSDVDSKISYKIQAVNSKEMDLFAINANTGAISLNSNLNYEVIKEYHLTILAVDTQFPEFIGVASLFVNVTDVNDNSPIFANSIEVFNIVSDTKPGVVIGRVTASDKDSRIYSTLTYQVSNVGTDVSTNGPPPFSVNPDSGDISLNRYLNVNDPMNITFLLEARDVGGNIGFTNVVVRQQSGNMAPIFTNDVYVANIDENKQSDVAVLTVKANDLDSGKNGEIMYKIISYESPYVFVIDPKSGQIRTNKSFDYENATSYTFGVTASDKGYPVRSSTSLVRVLINDVNEAPVFVETAYTLTVSESAPIGTTVLYMNYTDPDIQMKNRNLKFAFINDVSDFTIDSDKGFLTTTASLDFGIKNRYEFKISLRDQGTPPLTSQNEASVTIDIVNTDKNGPEFPLQRYSFFVEENSNGHIGFVRATIPSSRQMTYRVISDELNTMFRVNSSGSLSNIKRLDYENTTEYNFVVEVSDGFPVNPATAVTSVRVVLRDLNDNAPIVSPKQINITVSEGILSGKILQTITLEDADSKRNAQMNIVLQPTQQNFMLLSSNVMTSQIALKGQLDYEATKRFSFSVIVTNVEPPFFPTTLPVIVNVEDANDHAPVFTEKVYNISVNEDSIIGTSLLQVSAGDLDSGNNGLISFKLTPSLNTSPFTIDSSTGVISQTGAFDVHKMLTYYLTIIASDSGSPSLSGEATLIINIIPVNQRPPVFEKTLYEKSIFENTKTGLTVLRVKANDPDFTGKPLVYTIKNGNVNDSFDLNLNGEIYVKKRIDYEKIQFFNLTVSVRDSGMVPLTAAEDARVNINVLDINDNIPVFVDTPDELTLREGLEVGAIITTVTARDIDSGANGQVTFKFQRSTDYNKFDINRETGVITLRSPIDHKTMPNFSLYVVASDSGSLPMHAFHKISVKVIDINSRPYFVQDQYDIAVSEELEVGREILRVTAKDDDSGTNAELTFEITAGDQEKKFRFDKNMLMLDKKLDFETVSSYLLSVSVKDGSNLVSEKPATINLTVIDIFQIPQFLKSKYEDSIPESTLINTVVLAVDTTSESQVTYSILDPALRGVVFDIDSTGKVKLLKSVDFESQKQYRFLIRASTSPQHFSDCTAVITVTDINDNSPSFTVSEYIFNVNDPTFPNAVVGRFTATDADSGINAGIDYLIPGQSDSTPFKIDGDALISKDGLTFQKQAKYSLSVTAQDRGTPRRNSPFIKVTINVIQNNDTVPKFEFPYYNISIAEDVKSSVELIKLLAIDPDSGIYGQLRYSIEPSKDAALFVIDASSGVVRLANDQSLDFYKSRKHLLVVKVVDGIGLSTDAILTINIIDKNTHQPFFEKSAYSVRIADNIAVGLSVIEVIAVEKDVLVGAEVNYEILTGNEAGLFVMGLKSGVISLRKILQPDEHTQFELVVRGYNPGTPKVYSTNNATVKIHVLPSSIHVPYFLQHEYYVTVQEEIVVENLSTVTASINDTRILDTIRYSINGNSDSFAVDAITGVVSLKKRLDREVSELYYVVIKATTTFNSRSDKTTLFVNVTDTNDNIPFVGNGLTRELSISENVKIGSYVLEVDGFDVDAGDNAKLQYSVKPSEYFAISDLGVITLKKKVDYESEKVHDVKVFVSDMGDPPQSNETPVNIKINIINENDNVPRFTKPKYTAIINEITSLNERIMQVDALDVDDLAPLVYRLEGGDSGRFAVNNTNKWIVNTAPLQYVDQMKYSFICAASDGNFTAFVPIEVVVQDINNHRPNITDTEVSLDVTEYFPIGSTLTTIRYVDQDDGLNGQVTFSFLSGNTNDTFGFQNTNQLVLLKKLDFETSEKYVFSVTATDSGTPSLSAPVSSTITVNILNENDNAPSISPLQPVFIDEGKYQQHELLTFTVTDLDNSKISLSIIGDPIFSVKNNAGTEYAVMVSGDMDYENQTSYRYVVAASDNLFQTIADGLVYVNDVNERPFAHVKNYTVDINENARVGTNVVQIVGVDPDKGENAVLMFEIKSEAGLPFVINNVSGLITLNRSLDFEVMSLYQFEILIKDHELISNDAVSVKINILNINDNAPTFNQSYYEITIDENQNISYPIKYTDLDRVDCCRFEIIDVPTRDVFLLKPVLEKGQLLLENIQKLDYETSPSYSFTIIIKDTGKIKRSGTARVDVKINDLNDNKPVVETNTFSSTIPESTPRDSIIFTFVDYATDKDSALNGKLKFFTNDELFDVNSNLEMVLKGSVDYENVSSYAVTIKVFDQGTPSVKADRDITGVINIIDVNEHNPVFEKPEYQFMINEDASLNEQVLATDKDTNDKLRYIIPDSIARQYFSLNESTGVIRNIKNIDYETNQTFKFVVIAEDSAKVDRRTGFTTVCITVVDLNDNRPIFQQNSYFVNASEGLTVNSDVVRIKASDADSNANGQLSYYIQDDPDTYNFFSIDKASGMIRLARELDYESILKTHIIKVNISDNGVPPLWSNTLAHVYVYVLNENDNKPVFNSTHLIVSIKETDNIVEIATIAATDKDESGMVYSIVDGLNSNMFRIIPNNGNILNKVALDYEQQTSLQFIVRVTEINSTVSSTIHVTVNLIDVNDNAPVLAQTDYQVILPMYSTYVVKITATDRDSGRNGQLSYSLNRPEIFTIDSNGYISVRNLSLLKDTNNAFLVVTARDNGFPVRKSVQATVIITMIGRQEPLLPQLVYEITVNETLPIGTDILNVSATIPNGHGAVQYSIEDAEESRYFDINAYFGHITTKAKFNYDISPRHKFIVKVQNSLDAKKISFATVIINIIDFNDHRPVFVTKTKDIFIEETTGIDRLIATVEATDADKGSNADISYFIESGNLNFAFTVNKVGEVRLNNTLDRATKDFYTLVLRAQDSGNPKGISDPLSLRITVKPKPSVEEKKPVVAITIPTPTTRTEKYDVELQMNDNGDPDCKFICFIFICFLFTDHSNMLVHMLAL